MATTLVSETESRLLERLFGLHRLIDDEAQDAEIGGVRDGQGADVDAGLRERAGQQVVERRADGEMPIEKGVRE